MCFLNSVLGFLLISHCVFGNYTCGTNCAGLQTSSENVTESTELDDSETATTQTDVEVFDITNLTEIKSLRFATPCETPNGEPTYCIQLSQCPVLQNVVGKLKYADFLSASRCGPKNENSKNFKVCCGKYNNFRNVSNWLEAKQEDNKVFPKKCGTQRRLMRGRIYGGSEAILGEFPWLVRIVHKNKHGYKSYGCAGFLVHTKYVVTAAHCIESDTVAIRGNPYSVVIGEHNVETEKDCSPGGTYCAEPVQVSRINKIVVHPDYSKTSQNHHNDIAVIQLRKAAKLSEFVQPICLLNDTYEPQKYYISGWGRTESKEASPIKLKVDLMPYDKEECQEKFKMLNLEIVDSQICAGGEKLKDSCTGDSGGPLMMTPDGTTYFAVGLVSYGIGCGRQGWPGVYTNMTTYIEWLKLQILSMSLVDKAERIRNPKTRTKNNKTTTSPAA